MAYLVLSFLLALAGFSEPVPESKIRPLSGKSSNDLELRIVYPHEGDTLDVANVRFAGSVSRNARVRVQGQSVRVFPTGAFVGLVALKTGWNSLRFETENELRRVAQTVEIYRPPDRTWPEIPTSVDGDQVWPGADVHVVSGEEVQVGFVGSPGGTAFCTLATEAEPLLLKETESPRFPGRRGIYMGALVVPDSRAFTDAAVRFMFQGVDSTVFQFEAPGRVFANSADSPPIGVTQDSTNFVFDQLGGDWLFELPLGVQVPLLNRRQASYKVGLPGVQSTFMDTASVKRLPADSLLPKITLQEIELSDDENWVRIRLVLSDRVPFRVSEAEGGLVELALFNLEKPSALSLPAPMGGPLRRLRVKTGVEGALVVQMDLKERQLWGYRTYYRDNILYLSIRKNPLSESLDLSLRKLNIVVDAGHGG